MIKNKFFIIVLVCFVFITSVVSAQTLSSRPVVNRNPSTVDFKAADSSPSADFLVQGFDAFQKNDWASALFFLRKAVSLPDTSSPEVWYMLVMSEMFAEEYKTAIKDGEFFCSFYPDSSYKSFVEYQIGRALHYTGDYDASIKRLGLFCSRYPNHELYASGLFWIAESLFSTFYFDLAKPVYERIVAEFPDSAKYTEALYRIDLISQREREEKLLYLLKVTGEEYLSSKEDYERQLKQYQTEESLGLRKQLNETKQEAQTLKIRLEEVEKVRNQYELNNTELVKQNEQQGKELDSLKVSNTALLSENEKLKNELAMALAAKPSKDVVTEASVATPAKIAPVSGTVPYESSLQKEMHLEIEKLKEKANEIQKVLDAKKVLDNSSVMGE